MAGVKGRSGAPGQTRKAGPGAMPQKWTVKVGDLLILNRQRNGIGSIEAAKVKEITRKELICDVGTVVDMKFVPNGEIFKIVK